MSVVLAYKHQQEQEVEGCAVNTCKLPGVFVPAQYLTMFNNASTAIVLAQINYWYKLSRSGKPKLKVVKEGMYWLAKTSAELSAEAGLTVQKVDGAIKQLSQMGIIEVVVCRFNNLPTRHIRVKAALGKAFMQDDIQVVNMLQHVTNIPQQVGNMPQHEPLTESTTEITSETTLAEPKMNIQKQVQNQTEGNRSVDMTWAPKIRLPLPKATCKDIEQGFKAIKAKPAQITKETTAGWVYEVWRYEIPKHTSIKFVTPFTGKQCGQAKMLVGKLGEKWEIVLRYTLQDWIGFAKYVQLKAGVKYLPQAPNMDFMLKYAAEAMNKYLQETTPFVHPSQSNALVVDLGVGSKSGAINCTEPTPEPETTIAPAPKPEQDIFILSYVDMVKMLEDEEEDDENAII